MLIVENQAGMNVQVLDRAFLLGTVRPSTTRIFELAAQGRRYLTVRWNGGEARSEVYAFETSAAWRLIVPFDGPLQLELATRSQTQGSR